MTAVRDVDLGLRRFLANVRELEDVRVSVGIHADSGAERHSSGDTVSTIATVLELGSSTRAPLGWLRTTIDEGRALLGRSLADAGARVLSGEKPVEAFADAASSIAASARARVPVDTGKVRDAVEARVNGVRVG